jgi:site-specific DNA-methyltransferase (cytosine-N4-specific)
MDNYKIFHRTKLGKVVLGDSLLYMEAIEGKSVDLIMTSPPFGLVRKKEYGNVESYDYLEWFKPFAEQFKRILKPNGSLVIDIGGAWNKGLPTRSLYHYKLLIMLCEEFGFNLAQDLFWWNPSKLPSPAEWVTIRRIRLKDAINTVWWLSPSPYPRSSNNRVLQPYSDSMKTLLKSGYHAKKRPSGHDISTHFRTDNGASIAPNLLAIPNTESNSYYLRYCKDNGLTPHPARFPSELPEFFIRMLTDKDDSVIDPFAGSCVTGEVCERLGRKWVCIDTCEEYLEGSLARFQKGNSSKRNGSSQNELISYRIPKPGFLWDQEDLTTLDPDGGRIRVKK